ncbi:hypothetical protein VRU48_12505 [Pedobacter sp. KR3-3]|uniref:IPExxxVDY family protein n=1 Tax=Pedobacter albus TaxID=3113905 RepID=A0ABU7I975_9SPHI|nr:hypothetical protein [Pedobacter sp. KR3-3]MEE1945934.1 hypothetical protein [Pedobacter sp. KR3-3]
MLQKIMAYLRRGKIKKLDHSVDVKGLEMVLYGRHHEAYWDKLELVQLDEISYYYSFRFVQKNKIREKCSFQLVGVAENIDPNGHNNFDFYDPEESYGPTEVYLFQNDDFCFWIYLPLTLSPVVKIRFSFKNENHCKIIEHESILLEYEKRVMA